MMNYVSQFDNSTTKEKERDKQIDARDKWKVNDLVSLLNLSKANDCVPLLNMSHKKIKHVETDKIIGKIHVVCISMSFSKQNKICR